MIAAVAALGTSAAAGAASLPSRLNSALTVPGVSWSRSSAFVVDLRNGGTVYARNATLSLKPASNEKLLVSVAALDRLGASFRMRTDLLAVGTRSGSVWRGRLVLKGYGDPTLSGGDLGYLARRVKALGITRVTGAIVGDESFFDTRRTAPGWKPSFYKEECPPLSALIVDGGKVGRYTVDNPALTTARAFRRALRAQGVRVLGRAAVGVAAPGAKLLGRTYSIQLSLLVRRMNRQSDNFIAETLLKALGANVRGTGTTAAGALVVRRVLRERGVPLHGVRIADGSGLSAYDRVTTRALGALLISVWSDDALRRRFVGSLPVAGVSGTLSDRMRTLPARGRVFAKTGTTSASSALSGYVGTRYVFAVVQNGSPIPYWSARNGQDRFAQILAAQL